MHRTQHQALQRVGAAPTRLLLPPVGDAAGITAAMVRLVDDPDLRRRLVEGGRTILPRYTWSASAARHREVYSDLLAQVPG